jgi:hydroxymethylglutaryl-CoA lyase
MAKDELTGNMPTEQMLSYFDKGDITTGIDKQALTEALHKASYVFG